MHAVRRASVVRVVIVDDHQTFSRGLRLLFNAMPSGDFDVVATTEDAAAAARIVADHHAEVALVDLQMPPPGGLHAVAAIKSRCPTTAVLVLTGVDDRTSGTAAFHAGADGYLLKTSSPEELLAPIRSVLSGLKVMPGWLADSLVTKAGMDPDVSFLTDADRQLLRLLAAGEETAAIARRLFVSERTAKRQIATLLQRLGVDNRLQAAAIAGRCGIADVSVASAAVSD